MFAIAAAVLFVIAAFNLPGDLTSQPWFWGFLGFAAISLHLAWDIAIPAYRGRRTVVRE